MKCETPGCTNKAAKGRKLCYKCKQRRYVQKHPIEAMFIDRKKNAKRRGIEFDLTLEQFRGFCEKTQYHLKKGKSGEEYQIDRKDPDIGYNIDNIRVLSAYINNKRERVDLDGFEYNPLDPPF